MARSAITDATRRRAVDAAALAAPRAARMTIGPWELHETIATGESTAVHAARPRQSAAAAAAYAIKTIAANAMGSPGREQAAIASLRREAAVACCVRHPHLIQVLSASVEEPPYYVVMPRLPGEPLDRATSVRPWSATMALCIARQVGQALDALHRGGWRHADVKPSNIVVAPAGHATLIDLGFAQTKSPGRQTPQPLLGSPAYLAPEAFTSVYAADARSDLYSLGVVLFELLTGARPFTGQNMAELATQHLSLPPPDVRRLAPHLPSEVARLIEQLLAKQPLRRPQSAAELVERLVALEIMTFEDRDDVPRLGDRKLSRQPTASECENDNE